MKTIITIDPGAKGGIAVYNPDAAGKIFCDPMPQTEGDVVDFLAGIKAGGGECIAYMELVSGYAGKGHPGSAMFTFGRGFGFILGCLQALGYRVELVTPQKWQKALGIGTRSGLTKGAWKNKLKQRAQQLYPGIKVTLQTADALLLLEYAKAQPNS